MPHLAEAQLLEAPDPARAVACAACGRAQFNSATDAVSANVRFRYNFREGNDLWIVYNEGMHTDRHRITPTLPVTDERTILLKYTYTFQL